MLELEGVVKQYHVGDARSRSAVKRKGGGEPGESILAVAGVDLSVQPGEMVALHGPSGSGKTTLLLLIAALLSPDEGTIRFQGRPLSSLSPAQASDYLHRDVGFVYQSAALMPRVPAIENAAMKLVVGGIGMREAQRRALPWLRRVGLGEHVRRTPEQLSTGERQRVAIARALAGDPKLILADEPTGNLDSARSNEVVALLREVAHERGAAVVLVTHDVEAAAIADRSLTLRDGRIDEPEQRSTGPATDEPTAERESDTTPPAHDGRSIEEGHSTTGTEGDGDFARESHAH